MNEEALYETAAEEVKAGNIRQGLWVKCVVEASGDERRAKIDYIRTRVGQLRTKAKEKEKRNRPMPWIGKVLDQIFSTIFFWVKPKHSSDIEKSTSRSRKQ